MKRKKEIRDVIYKKRCSLSLEEIKNKSQQIFENLENTVEFINSKNIMFYVATKREVQTKEMIKKSLKIGKIVSVPIIISERINLAPSILIDFDKDLEKGKFGILEPKEKCQRLFSPKKLNLIILPGIAFDTSGNRIGRGMGYYDRFLNSIDFSTKTVALAFDMQIVDNIPFAKNDMQVNKIITEKRIIIPSF